MAYNESAMEGATPRDDAVPSAWTVGFVFFAGCLMIMAGVFQMFQGLAAVLDDSFFVLGRPYAFDMSVQTWGWVHMFTGFVVMTAGFFLFTGNILARLVGILIAVISAITNFFYIPYYPVWSLLIIGIDVAIIWALAVYGHDKAIA